MKNCPVEDFKSLLKYIVVYQSIKTKKAALFVERYKNTSVEVLMHKRGKFQKQIIHTSMIGLASLGFLSSGVIGGNSMVASSFPGYGQDDPRIVETYDPENNQSGIASLINFQTDISTKPRSETVDYKVKSGETVSQIAQKFDISVETIKWANNLESVNSIKPGQTLKILPVSGVAHTVKQGDTLEGIAKKYSASSQAIVDFPFNDIGDDFKLIAGRVLMVPEGAPPASPVTPKPKPQPQYLASNGVTSPSFAAPGGGKFVWPASSKGISQYFAWYHPGIDLPNPSGPPVVASSGGTVTVAGWPDNYGYGNRVVVDHGNGYTTLYAHLSNIYVRSGQHVSQGQTIGRMGNTGRSTGTHLHFEIRFKGIAVNPLSILK